MLTDNTPVNKSGENQLLEKRCQEIQSLVKNGQCSLIDLLGRVEKRDLNTLQIFRNSEKGLSTGNLIGVFEYKENDSTETIVIGDRFSSEKLANDGEKGEFLSFFSWTMLQECWHETPLWLLRESRGSGQINILNRLLILHLASQLERAWKKGRFRLYLSSPRYDCRVRGQLDLPRKIRMSAGLEDGNMAYRIREYSEENQYNRLFFRACLEAEKHQPQLMRHLRRTMPGFRIARQSLEQLNAGSACSDTRSLLNATKKKIINPIYRDYEALRLIARAVLMRSSHRSFPYAASGAPFVTGVFLDISKLWEEYLDKAVFQKLSSQPKRPLASDRERLTLLDGFLNIKPDFWWPKEERVLDAKFRPAWGRILEGPSNPFYNESRRDIQDDVYQLISYTVGLDYKRGGVIFPTKGKITDTPAKYPIVNGKQEPDFWLIPFAVPECDNYQSFVEDMNTEVGNLHKNIEAFLELEKE